MIKFFSLFSGISSLRFLRGRERVSYMQHENAKDLFLSKKKNLKKNSTRVSILLFRPYNTLM